MAYARSRSPTFDATHVKLTEGVPEELAVVAIKWRLGEVYLNDHPYDVLMGELKKWRSDCSWSPMRRGSKITIEICCVVNLVICR